MKSPCFVDINHPLFNIAQHFPFFQAASIEDVLHWYALTKYSKVFRFMILNSKGFLDLEATLEAARWLCAEGGCYVPVISLEPSVVLSLQRMKPMAIEVQVCFPQIGDSILRRQLLQYVCRESSVPIWVQSTGLNSVQLEIAMDCGCSAVILTE